MGFSNSAKRYSFTVAEHEDGNGEREVMPYNSPSNDYLAQMQSNAAAQNLYHAQRDELLNMKPGSLIRQTGYDGVMNQLTMLNGSYLGNAAPIETMEQWCERLQKRVEEVEAKGMDYTEYSRWQDELEGWRAKNASGPQPDRPDTPNL